MMHTPGPPMIMMSMTEGMLDPDLQIEISENQLQPPQIIHNYLFVNGIHKEVFAEDLRVCVQNLIQDQYQTNQVWFMSVQKLAKKKIPDQIILDIEDLDLEVGNEISDEDLQVGREILDLILELEDQDLEVGKDFLEDLEVGREIPDQELEDLDLEVEKEFMDILEEDLEVKNDIIDSQNSKFHLQLLPLTLI